MTKQTDFDAIVVGSGISGGFAAKELTERGLKVLLLERGKPVVHRQDYDLEGVPPWDLPNRNMIPEAELSKDYKVQRDCYAFAEATKKHFVKDSEHPYAHPDDKPFKWIRGYQTGGRSLLWNRQCYRLSEMDFAANKLDGYGVDWPIRYADIAPWYDHVEEFAGISGSMEGLPQVPDGVFQPPMEMTYVEEACKQKLETAFPGRKMIMGRTAHLTKPTEEQMKLGRLACQSRNECERGCSFGAYFSSQSATLPAAERTGNLTMVHNAVVQRVNFDEATNRATGVYVVDAVTNERREYTSKLVFMCASTLPTTQIMLNSTSERFPNGIANDSGALGHYLMDHMGGMSGGGQVAGFLDKYQIGRRPNGVYIPRYINIDEKDDRFLRGFGFQGGSWRQSWNRGTDIRGVGAELKAELRQPGPWGFAMGGFGEMLPYKRNRVWLDEKVVDQWQMPILHVDCEFGDNEKKMAKAIADDIRGMLEAMGITDMWINPDPAPPGLMIHEMGTARMGLDPSTSVLNRFNQAHAVPNLFVTDGSCMTSSACQNPSLTYMALTARAANAAADMLAEGTL